MFSSSLTIAVGLAFLGLTLNTQAAPTTAKIQCQPVDQAWHKGQFYSGAAMYPTNSTKIGYKYTTDSDGNQEIIVVNANENDSSIRLLDNVIGVQCNSTYLQEYSLPQKFGTNYPVKLLADVGQDGHPLCVGLNKPSTNTTSINLVPCSDYDDQSQENQFWIQQWKYGNFLPAIGVNSEPTIQAENYANLVKPSSPDAPYTTEPVCNANCPDDDNTASFLIA